MRRGSLRDSRRHDGPILSTQTFEPILNWVPRSRLPPNDAVCVQESADMPSCDIIYVGRPNKAAEFCLLPIRYGAEDSHKVIQHFEILTDPHEKTVWRKITTKFDPKRYAALPANVEWKNEPNKYIGKVSWKSGDVTVGTIFFEKPSWKVRYCLPSDFKKHYIFEISQDVNSDVSYEVLCSK